MQAAFHQILTWCSRTHLCFKASACCYTIVAIVIQTLVLQLLLMRLDTAFMGFCSTPSRLRLTQADPCIVIVPIMLSSHCPPQCWQRREVERLLMLSGWDHFA